MSNPILKLSFGSTAELQGNRLVKLSAANTVVVAAAAADLVIGVVDHRGADAGGEAAVTLCGVEKVEAGGAISLGALICSAADGKAATAADGNQTCGRALDAAAADGDFIRVVLATSQK